MSNIKNLEMAKAVFAKSYISIKKSFFGLCQKVIYTPTNSQVKAVIQEYSADEGVRLEQLLSLPTDKLEAELASKGKPVITSVGNCQLQACVSDDRQFCAVQLFRFYEFVYHPLGEPRFFEGKEAETISKLIS
jgi:hypothetical protein